MNPVTLLGVGDSVGADRGARVPPAASAAPVGGSLGAFRERVLRVSVLTRLLVVAATAVGLLSQESVDWKVTALIALATANVAYLITRVPWGSCWTVRRACAGSTRGRCWTS
jgi:hypothetical protein